MTCAWLIDSRPVCLLIISVCARHEPLNSKDRVETIHRWMPRDGFVQISTDIRMIPPSFARVGRGFVFITHFHQFKFNFSGSSTRVQCHIYLSPWCDRQQSTVRCGLSCVVFPPLTSVSREISNWNWISKTSLNWINHAALRRGHWNQLRLTQKCSVIN